MLFQLKDIYRKLRNDYNGDILEEYKNENIKNLFKKVSTELKEKNKGNTPMVNIIYNHFHGILPTPDYVSGPYTLTYHTSQEYNMKIYTFGETHGHENTCDKLEFAQSSNMDISTYLQKLFLNTDKFIDFYLEDVIFSSGTHIVDSLLDKLRYDFNNCINPSKRQHCIFKTVRTHFVDVRNKEIHQMILNTTRIGDILRTLEENDFVLSIDDILLHEDFVNEIFKLGSYKALATYVMKMAVSIPIISKELSRCRLDKKLLYSTFHEVLIKSFSKLFDINELKSIDVMEISGNILHALLLIIESPIIDLYTIMRMFKTFRKPNHKKENPNYFPVKPKYIIYYGGNAHSEIIRMFLEKLNFKEEFNRQSDIETSGGCLDMKGITLNFK